MKIGPSMNQMLTETLEVLSDICIGEGNPAHNALDAIGLVCDLEKPVGLLKGLPGLNRDRASDAGAVGVFDQVGKQVVAGKGGVRRNPRIVPGIVGPEVVVGVEHETGGVSGAER